MSSIACLLQRAKALDSPTAALDVELLLAHVLNKPRSYLYTWPEKIVAAHNVEHFEHLLQRRQAGEPIAYLLGQQGFWTLDLKVSPHTLIPRPETELMIETALQLMDGQASVKVLDLGTGTGAIALALASERLSWHITGVDVVEQAVQLAQENAQATGLTHVRFFQSDWFSALKEQQFHLILSNPPYIAEDDPHLVQGDVRFEPLSALVADENGLADIRQIIAHAPQQLYAKGWLVFEHGYQQAAAVRAMLETAGFNAVHSVLDLAGHERLTLGQWQAVEGSAC